MIDKALKIRKEKIYIPEKTVIKFFPFDLFAKFYKLMELRSLVPLLKKTLQNFPKKFFFLYKERRGQKLKVAKPKHNNDFAKAKVALEIITRIR